MSKATVDIVLEGYFAWTGLNRFKASSTTTLVRDGDVLMLVDPGSYTRKDELIAALAHRGLSPADITHVFLTHFHPDHFENSYLFPNASHIATYGEQQGDEYHIRLKRYAFGSYRLTDNIVLKAVPGHTKESTAALVETDKGRVAVVGDLFVKKQKERTLVLYSFVGQWWYRRWMLRWADFIIPGHGGEFAVKK